MAKSYAPTKKALGSNPGVSVAITIGGGPATLSVLATETIPEATYKGLSDADQTLFRAATAKASDTPPDAPSDADATSAD